MSDVHEMLDADRWASWVLNKRPDESMHEAARRVIDAANAGVVQPPGALEAAVIIDGPGDSWQRVYRAADVAKRNRGPRRVSETGSKDHG